MERPLVTIQGFRSKMGGLKPLLDHLVQDGLNGGRYYYVQNGQFFQDPGCQDPLSPDQVRPDTRVFRVVPLDREASPPVLAEQLKTEFKAIRNLTEHQLLDVAAHSMGGLVVRSYLDQHDDSLGKVFMGGTPHRGTRNATDGYKVVSEKISWAMAAGGVGPPALAALQYLRSVDEFPGANPALEDLNSRYAEQEARSQGFLTVGSTSFSTPSFVGEGWQAGDGLVEATGLTVEGADVEFFEGGGTKLHHTLLTDPDVFLRMKDFFGWTSA